MTYYISILWFLGGARIWFDKLRHEEPYDMKADPDGPFYETAASMSDQMSDQARAILHTTFIVMCMIFWPALTVMDLIHLILSRLVKKT